MKFYLDQNNTFVTVREGVVANTYAFYRLNKNNPAARGRRIQTRPMKFYSSMAEGFVALKIYARKQRWKSVGSSLSVKPAKVKKKQVNRVLPLFDHKPSPDQHSELVVINKVLYQQYKDLIVKKAVLLLKTEMVGRHNPSIRAIQLVIAEIRQSCTLFSKEEHAVLFRKLLCDTGSPVHIMDEELGYVKRWPLEQAYGGVLHQVAKCI